MTPEIQEIQVKIAQAVFDALPPEGWLRATYRFRGISRFAIMEGVVTATNGEESGFVADDVPFRELRERMAEINANGHAWYTAFLHIDISGSYRFEFDYDQLPDFDILPSKDKWEEEFRKYPRPELEHQIPDVPY